MSRRPTPTPTTHGRIRVEETVCHRVTAIIITAEGVETAEDFERMRDLGCNLIQGYLFGRPLSYERANQMVVGLGARRAAG